ncbi:MAG: hypothetical protein ACPGXY_00735 [Alphaproteobacteria bacterium]
MYKLPKIWISSLFAVGLLVGSAHDVIASKNEVLVEGAAVAKPSKLQGELKEFKKASLRVGASIIGAGKAIEDKDHDNEVIKEIISYFIREQGFFEAGGKYDAETIINVGKTLLELTYKISAGLNNIDWGNNTRCARFLTGCSAGLHRAVRLTYETGKAVNKLYKYGPEFVKYFQAYRNEPQKLLELLGSNEGEDLVSLGKKAKEIYGILLEFYKKTEVIVYDTKKKPEEVKFDEIIFVKPEQVNPRTVLKYEIEEEEGGKGKEDDGANDNT